MLGAVSVIEPADGARGDKMREGTQLKPSLRLVCFFSVQRQTDRILISFCGRVILLLLQFQTDNRIFILINFEDGLYGDTVLLAYVCVIDWLITGLTNT
ncbi:hypothetical protein BaRGS_00013032 [Batillaria attramentaria]|uniref:Uncharacterized protein n=1 Tax=Batillaria attramentaria TaxID=370345 RepID=A0ABD0L8M3_9CAEN